MNKVERESRRVAAAFDVGKWEQSFGTHRCTWYTTASCPSVRVRISSTTGRFDWIELLQLGDKWNDWQNLTQQNEKSWVLRGTIFSELMSRGLYCLGFDDENILNQLPRLTAHEQLELRLSMPREFWLPQWLQETS